MTQPHAIIWLDHYRATIIGFSPDASETHFVESSHMSSPRLHTKSGIRGSGHLADDTDFFDEVISVADIATEVLVTGPGVAKIAFERYARTHQPLFAKRIVGVETLDHPSNGELLAYARVSFQRVDQLFGDA